MVGLGGAWHGLQLAAGGGEAVARMLGGRRVDPATQDPLERRFVNVAEEMALAAGLPVPALYLLEREASVNAFAAGYTTGHSVVAVTRGALERLDRDELQGVVAHELSHVLHRDTRLDLQLMAVVGGLGILSLCGRMLLRAVVYDTGSRTRRKGNPLWPLGLALLVAGAFGTLCGRLVRFAVARQREWLADAAAVQFTRNPDGLAKALQKIADGGSAVASPHTSEAAHLFFARATVGLLDGLFSTHPPIAERIRRIAPHLAGGRARRIRRASPAVPAAPASPEGLDWLLRSRLRVSLACPHWARGQQRPSAGPLQAALVARRWCPSARRHRPCRRGGRAPLAASRAPHQRRPRPCRRARPGLRPARGRRAGDTGCPARPPRPQRRLAPPLRGAAVGCAGRAGQGGAHGAGGPRAPLARRPLHGGGERPRRAT